MRFFRGPADEPTARTLRRQQGEAQQLGLALGEDAAAGGLVFRLALETNERGGIEVVVFLALRGEERTECFWPVPLEVPAQAEGAGPVQLRLIADDGYVGPGTAEVGITVPARPLPARRGRASRERGGRMTGPG